MKKGQFGPDNMLFPPKAAKIYRAEWLEKGEKSTESEGGYGQDSLDDRQMCVEKNQEFRIFITAGHFEWQPTTRTRSSTG